MKTFMLVKQENTPDMYLNIIIALRRTFFLKEKSSKLRMKIRSYFHKREKNVSRM